MSEADVVVIGSGQGGVPFAVEMAGAGKRVVLFERGAVGGTCVNEGCTPSKAFLASAHAAGRARKGGPLGVTSVVAVDFEAVMGRVRAIRDRWREGSERRLQKAGVRLIRAEAKFVGDREVTGGGETVAAPLVILNTGASPSVPDLPGLAGTPFLTTHEFFELRHAPARAIVLGGGYVGLELGQGLARLGSEVHLVHSGARLLDREEDDVGAELARALEGDGARLYLGAHAARVEHEGDTFRLHLADGRVLEGDTLVVATGRRPNSASLDPAAGGVALEAGGFVRVDAQLRTSAEGVYAIGDVAGQPQFTHVAWEDFRRLVAILKGEPRTRDDRVLGYAVFTDPQVGRVGLDLASARAVGKRARAVTLPASSVARGVESGREEGFFRLVVDEGDGRILGATFVSEAAGELIHVVLALMECGATWQTLERSVFIHPTWAEGLPSLARLLVS